MPDNRVDPQQTTSSAKPHSKGTNAMSNNSSSSSQTCAPSPKNRTPDMQQSNRPEMLVAASSVMLTLAPTIGRLCAAKNQAMLSAYAMETWCAVLSVYPAPVVNRAVIEMALGTDPFPDLGKVVAKCQRVLASQSKHVTQADPEKLGAGALKRIAAALQLVVE